MFTDKCPVCGGNCIIDAEVLIEEAGRRFLPCDDCIRLPLDKSLPPPGLCPAEPCPSCGKRFIDDVFSHCHMIMAEEGVIGAETPLGAIGMPLISPGLEMAAPPFLPEGSLVLQTLYADRRTGVRLVDEVPEIKGVIRDSGDVPGISGDDLSSASENELLAGCDVRADIFRTSRGSFVIYKQQSLLHIEFPRGGDPKIRSVEAMIERIKPEIFVDACSGAGTLGIAALLAGVPAVVLNDAWYPAAFWSAVNLHANRTIIGTGGVTILDLPGERDCEISPGPVKIAESRGDGREVIVLWGDYMHSGEYIPKGRMLAAIDVFGKDSSARRNKIISAWKAAYGGDAFIP